MNGQGSVRCRDGTRVRWLAMRDDQLVLIFVDLRGRRRSVEEARGAEPEDDPPPPTPSETA